MILVVLIEYSQFWDFGFVQIKKQSHSQYCSFQRDI